jgi:hypothetical protein
MTTDWWYRLLADTVVIFHFLFIVFAIAGGLLALRWRWIPWIHLPAIAWGAALELFGWICPLTPLENYLRHAAGTVQYTGGFVEYYLLPIIYPAALTREMQLAFGLGLIVINLLIYVGVWRYNSRKNRQNTSKNIIKY